MFEQPIESYGPKRKVLYNIVKPFKSKQKRWFMEGHKMLSGQLFVQERILLYEGVKTYQPENCFEVGTWKGGGSTLFISQALSENKKGRLFTIDINEKYFLEAKHSYSKYLKHLLPFVDFNLGDYREIYTSILEATKKIDFLFLDGPEDANATLEQYNFFAPYFQKGTVVFVHDWFTEKARLVKEILQNENEWEIKKILAPPHSVGFAFAIKK